MAGRSGRRRFDPGSPLVDLDAVFADDALIDAIAGQSWGGLPRFSGGSADRVAAGSSRGSLLTVDPLTDLFESWRQELAIAPIPAPPHPLRTSAPVQRRPPSRSRTLRPALAIAAAIGALLVGAASIGSKDAPRESPLFALTQVLWPSRATSVASADQVDAILAEARTAILDGRTQDAQLALLNATVVLGSVDVVDGKGDKQQIVAAMWVEVAPQTVPAGTQPRSAVGARPTTPGTRSSADNPTVHSGPSLANLAAPSVGTSGIVQPTAPPLAGPQVVLPQTPSTGVLQAAIGPGWSSSRAEAAPSVDASTVTEMTAPTVSGATIAPAVDQSPVVEPTSVASVPSTPPPPTAPVDPPAEVLATDPPSATEQSPPAPTPSEPGPSVDTSTPDRAGPFSSQSEVSIPLEPAATGSG